MKQKPKVLICDSVHPSLPEALSGKYEILYRPDIDQSEVDELLHQMTGIVINSKTKMHQRQIKMMTQGKWIARLGSGLEIIDVALAEDRGIHVIRTPAANANAVAEQALGMLLCLLHKLNSADQSIRQRSWLREEHRGRELQGMTVGIIGYGQNGSRFAEKLDSMGVKILIYDKYKQRIDTGLRFSSTVELLELKKRSDVISFHVPLNEETTHYFSAEFMQDCKQGLIVINTSRGKVVDQSYLCEVIESEQVSGACLDVFEKEGMEAFDLESMQYLICSEKVVLTPHIAGWTFQSKERIAESIQKKLERAGFL